MPLNVWVDLYVVQKAEAKISTVLIMEHNRKWGKTTEVRVNDCKRVVLDRLDRICFLFLFFFLSLFLDSHPLKFVFPQSYRLALKVTGQDFHYSITHNTHGLLAHHLWRGKFGKYSHPAWRNYGPGETWVEILRACLTLATRRLSGGRTSTASGCLVQWVAATRTTLITDEEEAPVYFRWSHVVWGSAGK